MAGLLLLLVVVGCRPAVRDATAPAQAEEPAPAGTAEGTAPDEATRRDLVAAVMAAEFAWQDGRADAASKHYREAARLSDDPKVAEHAVRVALSAKRWEDVEAGLSRWRVLDADAPGIAQGEAALALARREDRVADRRLKALLEGDETRRRLGAQVLVASERDVALAAMRRLQRERFGEEVWLLLSQAAQHHADHGLAVELATRAVAGDPRSWRALFWRGHAKLRAGDRAGARKDFAAALAIDPDQRDVQLTYAAALAEIGDAAAAEAALRRLTPDDEVLVARAAYAARADDDAALAAVYAALRELPEPRPETRIELLGQLAELLEKREEALAWYRDIPRGERYLPAQLRIAVLLDQGSEGLDGAKAHLASLRAAGIEDDARLAETFLLEAELLAKRERHDEALAAYAAGLSAVPDERRLLYARALLNERLDRVDAALADLRRLVELAPEDADALNALGYTLADRTDRYEEARALIEKALALEPESAAIIDSMGWVEYRMGRLDSALSHLRKAFALQPDAEVAAHLGEVLWQSGQKEEARKVWSEGRAKEPDNAVLRATVERLDR